jgi:tRNA A-37 threonylcarbamoyl transferase component Bud32
LEKTARIELHDEEVVKHFDDPALFSRELKVYQKGLPMVPPLLEHRQPFWIKVKRVEGIPYLDAGFNECTAAELATTLARFHQAFREGNRCLCHWDNQPRNILLGDEGFFFIDFSESRQDYPEEDLTHLLIFWAAELEPNLMRLLVKAFKGAYLHLSSLDTGRWKASMITSFERYRQRRLQFERPLHHVGSQVFAVNLRTLAGALD